MTSFSRIDELKSALAQRLLVIDGAMGTAIQNKYLEPDDFGGLEYEGCNEYLTVTQPDVIEEIHRSYLDAGADIIETNTFGSTQVVLAEYGLTYEARRLNREAAVIARRAADAASTPDKPRFVAGSMGPTTKTISVTGGITFDELAADYHTQAAGLIEGGVDLLLLETSQDTLNVKAGLDGIDRAFAELGQEIPVAVQGTVEPMGTLLAGQDVEAFYTSVSHRDLLWIGLNCATGPTFMTDHIRSLAALSRFPVACVPNAGMPDEDGNYNETPEAMAETVGRFVESGWVNLIGGCCGTVPKHIELLVETASDKPVRLGIDSPETRVSGIETLLVDDQVRPAIVGERTNVLGSRRFRRLIKEGSFEEAAEIGRRQVRNGAHILDVCLQDPDRDEAADVAQFLDLVTKKVKAPIMIDSTDSAVIELALKRLQGKSIINSINLEDGEERFQTVVPLARRYGAALVVGCIDDDKEQAQAITKERKLEVAIRSAKTLTEKYGVPIEDIIFDPLVFPVGTGDQNYVGSGAETVEGVRLIKEALPGAKTVLGISNLSFGLPAAGREVLNSVFLYHCVQAGLDMAIVNSEGMERYASIPEEERKLAEDLIWYRGDDPVAAFADHFRDKAPKSTSEERLNLPLDERLSLAIIEGSKEGLAEDLDEALTGRTPLEIINGPLMNGMAEVGRQFNANQLIVAEVLQSAESMKFSVRHLELQMEQSESIIKGKVVLATVKGDVHDIGKNLVEIIMGNNGYQVINLGIKVPPQDLIAAYREHQPDMIGLSGLLVKSAKMMVETAQDFRQAGISCPVLVGGAALSNRFTRLRIAPEYDGMVAYAPDAMSGLALANTIQDADERAKLMATFDEETESMLVADGASRDSEDAGEDVPPARVRHDFDIPNPPDLRLHVLNDHPLDEIFPLINPQMLYVRHLGYKGRFAHDLEFGEHAAIELHDSVRRVEDLMLAQENIKANAVLKFFPANSDGQRILVYGAENQNIAEEFYLGRQSQRDGLCLADYLLPQSSGQVDYVGMFVVSVGTGVRALAEKWIAEGQFLNSHILSALALESAEAFAELLHQQMRQMWGFGDPTGTSPRDLFRTQYRGKRFSFGYPACPRLEDQEQLFRLLDVSANLNVELTEGFMMDPESSVSALVFHHPDAKYFNLSERDIDRLEERFSQG
ncbi:MAG: methionine synthase [Chloroflexi bacterium]|jgi:5-methyltetrahydrofolate--homocysteine methyltransferase|nr:methionine synthase [Chloroflexota bacterium]MDP6497999.1 methionine synthase [Dehalococcoidia bacterium]MQG53693.1 methionine synthase [SAR202 cluster bacterium]|tara:strand:+ start:72712 stop:76215 length:3504 start_codon:yes stop_codon:yes gene_type:complete